MRVIENYEIWVEYNQSEKAPMMKSVSSDPDYLAMREPEMHNGYFELMTPEGHNIILMPGNIKSIKSIPVYKET